MRTNFIKKIISVIVAALLLVSANIVAFAQTENVGTGTGSITVTNATEGKTYRLYKLLDATYKADDANAVAYSFTKTAENSDLFDLLNDAGSPFALSQVRNTNLYNVEIKEGKSGQDISAWVSANLNTNEDGELTDGAVLKAIASVEAEESEIIFDNLAYGYYFVTSTLGTAISINSNAPDQNIIDKNQGPSWNLDEDGTGKAIISDSNEEYDPAVVTNSVNVGDVVDFNIGVNTTNYNGDKEIIEYYINDTLGKGFEYYNKDELKVYIGDEELTKVESNPTLKQFTIKWNDESNTFRITIPWYDAASETFASENANNKIKVSYSAKLVDNDDTVYAGEGNKNTATFDFRDSSNEPDPEDPDKPFNESDTRETTTYTFALGFLKIDGKTKEALADAEFVVKNAAGKYLVADDEGDGVYLYTGVADEETDATTFVSTDLGKILVKGVAEGNYIVIETKAPNGYNNLLTELEIKAEIDSVTSYRATYTTYFDANGNVVEEAVEDGQTVTRTYDVNATELVVENNKGIVLPDTGGIGTKLFYIVGGVLVVGAAVLLVTKKRIRGLPEAE